jgi:hypothetical protein
VLVGAVLAPERREDAQLDPGGVAAEQRPDAEELLGGETVLPDQLRCDLRIAGPGQSGHWPGLTCTPVTAAPLAESDGCPCGGVKTGARPSGELLTPA